MVGISALQITVLKYSYFEQYPTEIYCRAALGSELKIRGPGTHHNLFVKRMKSLPILIAPLHNTREREREREREKNVHSKEIIAPARKPTNFRQRMKE